VQKLRKAFEMPGTRTDFRIFQELASALGVSLQPSHMDQALQEILAMVPGYGISIASVLAGGAEATIAPHAANAIAGDGRGDIVSAADTLFTSGTLTRYSQILQAVPERVSRNQTEPC
jgi:hypothetical protein